MRLFRFLLPLWLVLAVIAAPVASSAQVSVGVSVQIPPPPLPVYAQPPIPAPGYLWMPGYWAYGPAGYYWVPGTWVEPPAVGLLWTPGYWGWNNGAYLWHAGYWGPHVGFYGGINYGFGYTGTGFVGGYWHRGVFTYNRAVVNVGGLHVAVYNRPVAVNRASVSFNGGRGGLRARPSPQQETFGREAHREPTGVQMRHEHAASGNHALFAAENHGHPPIAATRRAGVFEGREIVPARGAPHPGHAGPPHPEGHPGPGGEHHDEHH